MISASIDSIESCSTVDGPGLRCTIFFNKCLLRCKYCHNPETWLMKDNNYSDEELFEKIMRFKPYFDSSGGGVTFSGGEPLLHNKFITSIGKKLKGAGVHIAIDTAGYAFEGYEDVLDIVDLILFDIKDVTKERFMQLTGGDITVVWKFLECARKLNKKFWIRQVIVPGLHDNDDFLYLLNDYIKNHFNIENICKIEFLPYHKMGDEKYEKLEINNPYKTVEAMNVEKCEELYGRFMEIFKK